MNKNLKLAFCSILILFAFASCEDDEIEVANKNFEVTINGQQITMDLTAEEFSSGFNLESFNYIDKFSTEEEPDVVTTKNRASIDTESMMFLGETVDINYFSLFNEDKSMDYEAGVIDMTLTVNSIDAFNQILDADFSGTFTDINTGENVTVTGIIKYGTN